MSQQLLADLLCDREVLQGMLAEEGSNRVSGCVVVRSKQRIADRS